MTVRLSPRFAALAGALLLLATSPRVDAQAPASGWATRPDMPTPRQGAAGGFIDGVLYVVSGLSDPGGGTRTGVLEAYDATLDVWTTTTPGGEPLPPLPNPRYGAGSAVVDGKLYVIGGSPEFSTTDVHVYDPVANTWAEATSMPVALSGMAAAVINGKIYIAGGGGNTYSPDSFGAVVRTCPVSWSESSIAAAAGAPLGSVICPRTPA